MRRALLLVDLLGTALLGVVLYRADLVAVRDHVLRLVPADLGTQEAALALICGALLGSAETGLALAAVRRGRDVVWVVWGLALAYAYSLGPAAPDRATVVWGVPRPLPETL